MKKFYLLSIILLITSLVLVGCYSEPTEPTDPQQTPPEQQAESNGDDMPKYPMTYNEGPRLSEPYVAPTLSPELMEPGIHKNDPRLDEFYDNIPQNRTSVFDNEFLNSLSPLVEPSIVIKGETYYLVAQFEDNETAYQNITELYPDVVDEFMEGKELNMLFSDELSEFPHPENISVITNYNDILAYHSTSVNGTIMDISSPELVDFLQFMDVYINDRRNKILASEVEKADPNNLEGEEFAAFIEGFKSKLPRDGMSTEQYFDSIE